MFVRAAVHNASRDFRWFDLQAMLTKPFGPRAFASITAAALGIAVFTIVLPSNPAIGQGVGNWFSYAPPLQRPYARLRRHVPTPRALRHAREEVGAQQGQRRKAPEQENRAAGPLFAVISLSNQHISIYNASGLVARFKVSTGMPGHRTPTGIFSIIGRERWHRSNIYSGAPMPYMQRITWSGIAMHLGVVPGYPASHGCVRLPAGSAERLWGMTKIGERVVISPHEVGPAEIAHAMLPVPKLRPSPPDVTETAPAKVTEIATTANEPLSVAAPKMLNPVEYAQALKVRAAADVASATKAVKDYSERTGAKSEHVRRALAELQAAEAARAHAEAKLAAKGKALAAAKTPSARRAAEAAKTAAQARLLETTRKFDEVSASEALKTAEAHEALDAERDLKEARAALANAQATAKEAERRLSPVSVLVSKKDSRVYIRQGLAPVLDAPAIIRDPEIPLGTHVFIATSQNGGPALGWSVVSLPASPVADAAPPGRREKMHDQMPARFEQILPPSNATQALERIQIPMQVNDRISELLWTGGSLIISDQPLSSETSDVGTDLVVTTR